MKPSYATLKSNHYSANNFQENHVSREKLHEELGYNDAELLKQNPAYQNTCASRMSLALIKSGVRFDGRLKIKTGKYKGRTFEPGAKLLADQLAKPHVFGKPQIINATKAIENLSGKKGVIFFWKISGYNGGHIDIIESTNSTLVCNSACYFDSKEIWFWPLD